MAVLIRTDDVAATRRTDAWLSVICDTLGPLDVRMDRDAPLEGEIHAGRLGSVGVGRIRTSTPHSVHRTRGLIRGGGPELYRVVLVMSGQVVVSQDDRQARLGQGEFAVYDFARPYDLAYNSGVHLAVFSLPRDMVHVESIGRLTAVPIPTGDGTGALAAPLMRRVATDVESYQPASAARLSTVVTDLIGTAVAEHAGRAAEAPEESQTRMLLFRVHAFIEDHLGDLSLDPATVAAAHHLSLRHLHRLFATQDTTVSAWIRHRRLERCRRDLADPALHDTPVAAIAARWGLPDSAHFSRLFRAAYGLPPSEYRRARLLRGTDRQGDGTRMQAPAGASGPSWWT
ncbi:helix-turn-helix domain-containing protein [Nonomuraea sp. NPDC050328]|uniref:AraC-like ligand-binding domain-containing protein n=1 Tax=Nonomuraea sp. NPDC050328 TaxID=3364361 RepID=UPI0037B6E08E